MWRKSLSLEISNRVKMYYYLQFKHRNALSQYFPNLSNLGLGTRCCSWLK